MHSRGIWIFTAWLPLTLPFFEVLCDLLKVVVSYGILPSLLLKNELRRDLLLKCLIAPLDMGLDTAKGRDQQLRERVRVQHKDICVVLLSFVCVQKTVWILQSGGVSHNLQPFI